MTDTCPECGGPAKIVGKDIDDTTDVYRSTATEALVAADRLALTIAPHGSCDQYPAGACDTCKALTAFQKLRNTKDGK